MQKQSTTSNPCTLRMPPPIISAISAYLSHCALIPNAANCKVYFIKIVSSFDEWLANHRQKPFPLPQAREIDACFEGQSHLNRVFAQPQAVSCDAGQCGAVFPVAIGCGCGAQWTIALSASVAAAIGALRCMLRASLCVVMLCMHARVACVDARCDGGLKECCVMAHALVGCCGQAGD